MVDVREYKRIGLRFINRIEEPSIDNISSWSQYINQNLIPNYECITLPDSDFSLRRNLIDIVFGDGEHFLRYRVGIWNKDFPSKIILKGTRK